MPSANTKSTSHSNPMEPPYDPAWVVVGKFGRTHGLNGDISFLSFMEPFDELFEYPEFFIYQNHRWQSFDCSPISTINTKLLFNIKGIDTPEAAQPYTNRYLSIKRGLLPTLPDGEFYWHDLIGLNVISINQVDLGTVSQLISAGASPLFIINQGKKQRIIPYTDDAIVSINLDNKTIIVNWPEDF